MGVLFFVVNAVFALVILLMVLWVSVRALLSKDPDTRYQPMRDDRGSFIKSQTNLGTTELDALGATARGDQPGQYGYAERKRMDLEDENESMSSSSVAVDRMGYAQRSRSPIDPPNQTLMRDGFNGSASPYSAPGSAPGTGYGSPYTQRSAQQSRAQNNASPANIWQRGVGY
jgi:hypothetical protein